MSLSPMETLPDEILVHILSFVRHAVTLLDTLPLVCQRWRRLCRDTAVWDQVDLDSDCDESAARVLLRAPALRSINLCPSDGVSLLSAVKRSRVVVSDCRIAFPSTKFPVDQSLTPEEAEAEVKDAVGCVRTLILRSRSTLQSLTLIMFDACEHFRPLLESIPELHKLQSLHLEIGDNYPYTDELQGASLPLLYELRVNRDSCIYPAPVGLVTDLLRASSSSLELLVLPEFQGVDVEDLTLCRSLNCIVLEEAMLPVLQRLPLIEVLAIRLWFCEPPEIDIEGTVLKHCVALPRLKHLMVYIVLSDAEEPDHVQQLEVEAKRAVRAVSEARPDLESVEYELLVFSIDHFVEDVGEFE